MSHPGSDICGVVLAGVHAWGESPLDELSPRPLLPVAGRPLFTYPLDWMAAAGVQQAVICANSQTHRLRSLLDAGHDIGMVLDFYEDRMPRGPAGCIADVGARTEAGTFVVVDGTVISDVDLVALLRFHKESGAAITVVASRCSPGDDEGQNLEPAGIYIISRSALSSISLGVYQDIKEVWLPRLHASGERVVPFAIGPGVAIPVLSPASYLDAHDWVLTGRRGRLERKPGYRQIGEARVHESCQLASDVRLLGACLIGPGSRLGSGVSIHGPTVIGRSVVLDNGVIVNRSVVWSRCRLREWSVVDRCVVGLANTIASGTALRSQLVLSAAHPVAAPQLSNDLYWGMKCPVGSLAAPIVPQDRKPAALDASSPLPGVTASSRRRRAQLRQQSQV